MIGSPSFGVWFCSNKSKSTVESTFDDAKVRRIKNRKPLYRTYNRGYIGDAMPDYQTVISIRKCLVNFYRTRWHAASFLHIPFLLGQIADTPQLFERFPFRFNTKLFGKQLG